MKLCFFILMALITCQVSADAESITQDAKSQNEKVVFLSYPHTGTNWTMCSLQFLTKRKFLGCSHKRNHRIWNRLGVEYDKTKRPIYRTHFCHQVLGLKSKNYKLLLIMRNYREMFFRKSHFRLAKINCFRKRVRKFIHAYLGYFRTFEKWPEGNRHLFTYEELLTDPKETLGNILTFLDEPKTFFENFMLNINVYKQQCLQSYHKQHVKAGGSLTKGRDFHYYSKKVHPQLIAELDAAMRQTAGEKMWQKYFAQYCVEL